MGSSTSQNYDRLPLARRPRALQYALAFGATWAALGLALLLPHHDTHPILIFFTLVIAGAAWNGGARVGLFATAASLLEAMYFLMQPLYSLRVQEIGDIVRLASNFGVAVLVVLVVARMRTVLERNEALRAQEMAVRAEAQAGRRALAESEGRFRVLFGALPIAAILFDPKDLAIRAFNDTAPETLGYTRGEFERLTISDIDALMDREQILARVRNLGGGRASFPTKHRTKSGELRDIIVVRQPVTIEGQRLLCAVWQDVTERNRVEEALQAAQRQLEAIIDGSSSLIFVKDLEGRFVIINRMLEQLLARSRDEIKGKTDFEVFPQEMAEYYREHDRKVAESGAPIQIEEVADLADGKRHVFLANKFPLFDAAGQVYAVCGISHDITARKRAEQALREGEERLSLVLQSAEIGTWDWNIASGELIWSPQCFAIFGLTPDAVMTHERFLGLIYPADRQRIEQAVQTALEQHEDYNVEMRITWPDGSVHWVAAMGKAYYDHTGRPVRMSGATLDITERKVAEQALIQSEKLASTGRLAATIAHEINNPLAAAMNAVYVACLDESMTPATRELLGTVDAELRRAAQITRQTLGFYREDGVRKPVILSEIAESVRQLYQKRIADREVVMVARHRNMPEAWAIAGEVRQVVANLVANALDACEAGGKLHIRTSAIDGWARITVADTGSGISGEHLRHIFDAFFTTKNAVGTGLGLWVTKQIVKKHGGRIRVRSHAGKGTVFCVYLPITAERPHLLHSAASNGES